MLEIKIKYLRDIQKIEKINVGDWIDLRCAEDTFIDGGRYKQIPLGVAMELPQGYMKPWLHQEAAHIANMAF